MSRKPKHPHRHTGKVIPLRTVEMVEKDVHKGVRKPGSADVTLEYWHNAIDQIWAAESALVKTDEDIPLFRDRVAVLSEAKTWLAMFERQWADDDGNDQAVSAKDAKMLAYNAVRVGFLIHQAMTRLLENSVVDGMEQYQRAKERGIENDGGGFKIDRETLLAEMKKAASRYPSANQKRLCEIVAENVSTADRSIGGERLRDFLQDHKIRAAEYKPKK